MNETGYLPRPQLTLHPDAHLLRLRVRRAARRRIAGRLEGGQVVAARGVAPAALLDREGSSPLYSRTTSEDVLRHRLAEVADALETV